MCCTLVLVGMNVVLTRNVCTWYQIGRGRSDVPFRAHLRQLNVRGRKKWVEQGERNLLHMIVDVARPSILLTMVKSATDTVRTVSSRPKMTEIGSVLTFSYRNWLLVS
jgi:hypothetical protein